LGKQSVFVSGHQRKALVADLADGFAALPGGYGTSDELLESLTWAQLGLHARPTGLLNTAGYFDALLAWLDQMVRGQSLRSEHRRLLLTADSPAALLHLLLRPPPAEPVGKWITPADR
jgi:uncharacterized protein (TIGR00730 family)